MTGGRQNLQFPAHTALAEWDRSCRLVSMSKTLQLICHWSSGDWLRFCLLGFQTCTAVACSRSNGSEM